ncbi:MAG TPA: hypothetical protein VLA66_04020, partial [Thermoanaerobaculia bacterium]|nr:hypothetical protein [Thermoanaerobaculia bacterium]
GLMAAGLRTRWPTLPALGSALAFGLASPHLAVDAQGLWAQTGETASLGLAVALLSRRRLGTVGGAAAGIASGAAFFCRPTALLLLPVLAALPQRPARRALRAGLIAATVVVASVLLLQLRLYGHPLGGYGLLNEREGGAFGTAHLAEGMAGVLVSPSRGLLVFCPWVLMVALATCASRRPRARRVALGAWISAAAVLLAAAGHAKWWGGHSLGPRLAIEAAFALALALPPVWGRGRRSAARRVALAALVILSAGLQLALARSAAAGDWNEAAIVDHLAGRVLWRWKDSQLAAALIPGWTLELPPYDETRLDPRQAGSRRVFFDLGEAADARYETDPFRTSPLRGLAPAFRRLDPDRLRTGKQLFRFLPRGAPNAVTVGEGEVAAFDVHPLRDADLFVLLSALDLAGVPEGTEVARLVLRTSDGKRRDYPLRLEEDVFRFGPASGRQLPPRAFLYAGLLNQPDVLIGTQLRARRLAGALERVELRGTSKGVRVSLLAATLAAPERRGKGRRAARPEVIDRVREK